MTNWSTSLQGAAFSPTISYRHRAISRLQDQRGFSSWKRCQCPRTTGRSRRRAPFQQCFPRTPKLVRVHAPPSRHRRDGKCRWARRSGTLGEGARAKTPSADNGRGVPSSIESAAGPVKAPPRCWLLGAWHLQVERGQQRFYPASRDHEFVHELLPPAARKLCAIPRAAPMGLPKNGLSVSPSRAGTGIPASRRSSHACRSSGADPNRLILSSRSDHVRAQCSRN